MVALALAGMPLTIARFSWLPWKAETLKAERSVICAGAAQTVLEVVREGAAVTEEEGRTVTAAVAVEGIAEIVVVLSASVTVIMSVIIWTVFSVKISGGGTASEGK